MKQLLKAVLHSIRNDEKCPAKMGYKTARLKERKETVDRVEKELKEMDAILLSAISDWAVAIEKYILSSEFLTHRYESNETLRFRINQLKDKKLSVHNAYAKYGMIVGTLEQYGVAAYLTTHLMKTHHDNHGVKYEV